MSALIRRCLEKDERHRFQSARDLAFALEAVAMEAGKRVDDVNSRHRRRRAVAPQPPWRGGALVIVTTAAAALTASLWARRPAAEISTLALSISCAPGGS